MSSFCSALSFQIMTGPCSNPKVVWSKTECDLEPWEIPLDYGYVTSCVSCVELGRNSRPFFSFPSISSALLSSVAGIPLSQHYNIFKNITLKGDNLGRNPRECLLEISRNPYPIPVALHMLLYWLQLALLLCIFQN